MVSELCVRKRSVAGLLGLVWIKRIRMRSRVSGWSDLLAPPSWKKP
jgi:hypothetical protein